MCRTEHKCSVTAAQAVQQIFSLPIFVRVQNYCVHHFLAISLLCMWKTITFNILSNMILNFETHVSPVLFCQLVFHGRSM